MKAMLITNTSRFIKIASFSLGTFSLFFLFKQFLVYPITTTSDHESHHLSFFNTTNATTPVSPQSESRSVVVVERTGIINEMGIMTDDFIIGEFDEALIQTVVRNVSDSGGFGKGESDERKVVKLEKFRVCDESLSNYIPCLDNVEAIWRSNSSKYERHCPEKGKGLDCLVPRPKEYKLHITWPKSRDEVWFDNVPSAGVVEDKESQKWITKKDDKFIFPETRTKFIHGADEYLDKISKMAPEIAFGRHTRVALDIDSGVATFGAYLMGRNVTTLSIAQKDVHENQIQFALERGVPAMVGALGTRRLPYPSQAFDLIHCSSNRIDWARDGGILLLEVNRILRAGGYFVMAVARSGEDKQAKPGKEMDDLMGHLCWNLVNKDDNISIWQKPLNNTCYLNRDPSVKPSLCEKDENPENIWYANIKGCITRLPENGYGANITDWPARLHSPPDRLFSIQMDADKSRRELYKADSKYWNDIVYGYVIAFHVNDLNNRNVMDMRAGYGGFAAALLDYQVNCWIMNVVPVSGSNTLPVIYDRGLIGVMHDWCEPLDTYPRTYDMLHAAGLFSIEQRRSKCNISSIMLEMDRILRPGGRVYIRDTTVVIDELQEIAKAMGWVTFMFDSGEGPHSNWKLITCEKRL